jgi:hypothetical protein
MMGAERAMNNTTYGTYTPRGEKFIDLVGGLQHDVKLLIKKEIELAKAEMSEKVSAIGRNAAYAAAGGVLALMAAFMLLLGLGAIISRLIVAAGMSPAAAYFISYMGLAILLGAIGYALIHKAMNAFSKISLAPEKALVGVQAAEPVPIEIKRKFKEEKPEPKQNSDDLQSEVIAARTRMDSEINELKARLTPAYMARSMVAGLKHHPLRAVLLSAASTGLGGYLYWRKQQRLAAMRRNAGTFRRWLNLKVRHA